MKNFWLNLILYCLLIIYIPGVRMEGGRIAGKWKIKYGLEGDMPELYMGTNVAVNLTLEIYDIEHSIEPTNNAFFEFATANTKIATVEKRLNLNDINGSTWQGMVTIKGHYFGYTQLYLTLNDLQTNRMERSDQVLKVRVVRSERVDIKIFTYTAVSIMLLMFINLGTVLDLKRTRSIFLLPVGPLLGFCSRYAIMPGLAIGLGALVFPNDKYLQLALFLTAIPPSGAIANICNVFLKGNINLSLAITTVNSLLALAMLPLWIFLMGPVFNPNSTFKLPYVDLLISFIGLVFPLILGISLRIFLPKTTIFIFRFLKPACVVLSLCLVAVTVGLNAFAFQEVTFMIFLASLFLPIIGYILSFLLSKMSNRSATDAMTIAVEGCVINMSSPIVLLEYIVEQPRADMLVVVPMMSALISLCFILIFYTVRRVFGWNTKQDLEAFDEETYLVE